MKTALKTVKGLGSGGNAVEHWWLQRLTAIALIPLFVWFVITLLSLGHSEQLTMSAIFSTKISVIVFYIFLAVALFHGNLGFKVVVEDYVGCKFTKFFLLITSNLLVGLTSVFLLFTLIDIFISNI